MYWAAIAAAAKTASEYGNSYLQSIYNNAATSKAVKQNVLFWQMQNKYNLPSNQMERLKDAGLNPNLIYGSVSNTAGPISTNVPHEAQQVPNTNYLNQYMDLMQKDAMTQQIEAQTELARAQARAVKLENSDNEDNGTSRATPYPIKIVKRVVKSTKDIFDKYSDVHGDNTNPHIQVYDKSKPAFGSNVKWDDDGYIEWF